MSTPATSQTDAAERVAVRRLRGGDPQAFEALYRDYAPRLFAFCHRITGNEADAADLVQETFLRVMRRLPSLDLATLSIGAYLYATARNLSYTRVQRAARERPDEHVADAAGPDDDLEGAPEGAALLAEQRHQVRAANARLAPRQRMALALCDLEGRPYREIGEILGIDENAVAQLVSRARIRLRQELRLGAVDRHALPPACAALLGDLSAHLDGKLGGARLAALETHLAGCPTCRAVRVQLAEASHRYRALLPALPLLGLFEETARAAVREGLLRPLSPSAASEVARTLGSRRRRGVAVIGVAALLLLGTLAAVGVAITGDPDEEVVEAATASSPAQSAATPPAEDETTPAIVATATGSTSSTAVTEAAKQATATATPPTTSTAATTPAAAPTSTSAPATTTTTTTTETARTDPPRTTTPRTVATRTTTTRTTPTRTTTTASPPTTDPIVTPPPVTSTTETTTTITPPPPPPPTPDGPNLVIASITANPNMLLVVVRNAGTQAAAASTLTATFSSLTTPFQGPVPALAPGAVGTVAISCAGAAPPAGTWTATADGLFAVAETAEGDNGGTAAGTC